MRFLKIRGWRRGGLIKPSGFKRRFASKLMRTAVAARSKCKKYLQAFPRLLWRKNGNYAILEVGRSSVTKLFPPLVVFLAALSHIT
jgi:hypothetical protein